jgi:arsenite-transporting ATPase
MDPFKLRNVFFGGKGGVGKTTCASAFALLASQKGVKTLLVSTDPAHSLSDLFGVPIGNRETELSPGLRGLEIDPDHEAETYVAKAKALVERLGISDSAGAFSRQMDLAVHSPGTQEAALFDKVTDLITRTPNPHDLLVFDTAPTGQTLRLLTLPERMGAWAGLLAKRRERVSSFRKMFSNVSGKPAGEDAVSDLLENRKWKFEETGRILTDPSQTGFYLVLIPEKLPILETKKAIPVLEQYRIPIRGMIVNRLLPENAEGEFLRKRKAQERSYLDEIETLFTSRRRAYLKQGESDVSGMKELRRLGREMESALTAAG